MSKTKTKRTDRAAQLISSLEPSSGGIQPEFIGPGDAELLTGVSRWTWRVAAYQGRIESCKIGNRLLIPLSEVRRLISEGTRPRRDGLPAGAPAVRRPRNAGATEAHA